MIRYTPPSSSTISTEGPDLTSLIDVIFTLIIFLILTMGTTQVLTEIQLSHSSKPVVGEQAERENIVIEVNHNSHTWRVDQQPFNDFEQFSQFFLKRFKGQSELPVFLALDQKLPVEQLMELMDFLALNGYTNIRIVSRWKP